MVALILLFVRDAGGDKVLDRYVAFHRANPAFSTDFKVTQARGAATGHMVVDRNVNAFIHFGGSQVNYSMSTTPEGVLEVNYAAQVYDEYPGLPTIHITSSRISGMTRAIPGWLLLGDLRAMFQPRANFKLTGREVDEGVTCDVTHAHVSTSAGTVDLDVAIDETGRVYRFKSATRGMAGLSVAEWKFTRTDPIAHIQASAFRLLAPLGYIPYALPEVDGPLPTGQVFPALGWRGNGGGAFDVRSRLGARGGFVAILSENSEPSARARASLARLRGAVPVVTLADMAHALADTDGFDASGKLIGRIAPPATPLFMLLDAAGKIKREWMGYDPDHAATFEQDVRSAFRG